MDLTAADEAIDAEVSGNRLEQGSSTGGGPVPEAEFAISNKWRNVPM
jgi:hypothetical protein